MSHKRFDVVVVGAGVSGLSCASHLRRLGADVLVLERANRVGGSVRSRTLQGGFVVDDGPQTIRSGDPELFRDFHELGIASLRTPADASAARRYVLRHGRPEALPTSPAGLLTTGVLSWRGKLRLLAEPFIRRSRQGDESVRDFFARRLGPEAADGLVDPFISGIHAGNPEALSMRETFPEVWAGAQNHGSLFRWALARRSSGAEAAQGGGGDGSSGDGRRAPSRPEVFSFAEGLSTWPEAMARTVGADRVRLGAEVRSLVRIRGGWTVRWRETSGQEDAARAARVVLALPAGATANMLEEIRPAEARALRDIPYAPVAVVQLAYPRDAVRHPMDGFGVLCPARGGRSVLGSLWISSLFPERAPTGTVLMACFLGGARRPELVKERAETLVEGAHREMVDILRISAVPVLHRVQRWPAAIPQSEFGHANRRAAAGRIEEHLDGLHLLGSWRGGTSLPQCWRAGMELARTLAGSGYADGAPSGDLRPGSGSTSRARN